MRIAITLLLFFITSSFYGQQLIYRPVNPMFGGDTFNYQQLLAGANAQNSFTDNSLAGGRGTELEQFSDNLTRQLLGQLSRSLFGAQLGEGLQPGSFTIGNLSIDVFDSAEGLVIEILDTTTGEQTQVVVPN